jgi:hypothetical protein
MGIFDDDESGMASGPEGGDLGAVGATGPISIEMSSAGEVELDLDFNWTF